MSRDPAVTHRIMSSIKSRNTKPETLLARAMWQLGLRYRKQYKIIGRPDFVFIKKKIAVFCDGDFWHGNNWNVRGIESLEHELAGYSPFWREKILKNIERAALVNDALSKDGWLVLRFWESDIKKDPILIASMIYKTFQER